jgi:hypothetical protein
MTAHEKFLKDKQHVGAERVRFAALKANIIWLLPIMEWHREHKRLQLI